MHHFYTNALDNTDMRHIQKIRQKLTAADLSHRTVAVSTWSWNAFPAALQYFLALQHNAIKC